MHGTMLLDPNLAFHTLVIATICATLRKTMMSRLLTTDTAAKSKQQHKKIGHNVHVILAFNLEEKKKNEEVNFW